MKKIPLILDCDPGLDDAVALLLALAHPESINLLGVTTVVGNGPVQQTQENARRICQLAGRLDMKVFQGCPRHLFVKVGSSPSTYTGADIHGETGLGGCKLPFPTIPLQSVHAVSFILQTLLESSEKITIAASGPLTNIACALIMEPSLKDKIEKIVLMGGVIGLGNITPSAEYNFFCDPQAASVVFTSGVPIVMIGLDATRQTHTSESWLRTIESINTPISQAVVDMLSYYHRVDALFEPGVAGGVLHDPNVIAYLLKPELYKGRDVYVEIDVSPTIMAGRSTVDWYSKLHCKPNAYVVNEIDVNGFFEMLTEALGRYIFPEQKSHTCSHC
ncbi:MAG: nucleoside hydrolase [Alphaproteobacteria bacterium]|nr:nucleoside hydrolase [Alphaproteobacteria bacterium]